MTLLKKLKKIFVSREGVFSDRASLLLPAVVIFLSALVLKLGFVFFLRNSPFVTQLSIDPIEHDRMARAILQQGLVREGAFYFAPLYPYLLAACYALLGVNHFGMVIVQGIVGALNVVVVFLLAHAVFARRRIALIAVLLTLLYGVYYFYEVLLLKTTWAVFLQNVSFLLLFLAARRPTKARWFLSGVFLGLAALLRGNLLLLVPFILLWFFFAAFKKQAGWLMALLWLLGVAAGIAPATLHNAVASRDFVLTTYQGGTNFYIGNHEGAKGTYQPLRPDREIPEFEKADAVSIAEETLGRPLRPSEISAFWFREGLRFIAGRPADWLRLMGRKISLFHNYQEIPDTIDYTFFRKDVGLIRAAVVPFWFVFSFAVLGLGFTFGRWREHLLLYLATLGSILSVLLGFIFARYRLPVMTFYVLFASFGLSRCVSLARERQWRKLLVPVIVLALATVFSTRKILRFSGIETQNNLGIMYMEIGKHDEALSHFQEALDGDPGMFRVHGNMARAYELKGDIPRAIAEYEQLLEGVEKEAGERDVFREAEYFRASRDLMRLLKLAGEEEKEKAFRAELIARYRGLIGDTKVKREQVPGLKDRMDRLLVELNLEMAMLLREGEAFDDALAALRQALAIDKNNRTVLFELVTTYRVVGDQNKAVEAMETYLAASPELVNKARYRAEFYLTEKQYPQALEHLQQALAADPKDHDLYDYLAECYFNLNENDKARDALERSLRLEYDNIEAHFRLGLLAQDAGDTDKARQYFEKVVSLNPEHAQARANLGVILWRAGQLDKAEVQLKEALRVRPDSATDHNNLGVVLSQQGRADEASGHFETALKLDPDFTRARFNLALAYNDTARTDKAIHVLEELLARNPGNDKYHFILGQALMKIGQVREAERRFAEAFRLNPQFLEAKEMMDTARGWLRE